MSTSLTEALRPAANTTIGLNVVTEFIAGVIYPGQPIGNCVFKVYGYMTLLQALDLSSDLKLGIYTKVSCSRIVEANDD